MLDERNPDLRIVGGHPVLDLVNTVAPRSPVQTISHEYLTSPADLVGWAERVGVLEPAEVAAVTAAWQATPAAASQALAATLDVREATYTVLAHRLGLSGTDPGPALERLTLRWAAAAARSALLPDRLLVGTNPNLTIPDRLAHAAVQLVSTVDLNRLKVCPLAEGGCGWLFLDHSRNGSRRWCAMADCGTQAKSRRLTARRRDHRNGLQR